jgi:cohesin complex subunit SA-1/2
MINIKDGGEEYPIVSRNKDLKIFSKNFLEFWDSLIKLTQEEILFDEVMTVYLYTWMSTLSKFCFSFTYCIFSSRIRPYRHTATLAIFSILDALISVSEDYKEKINQTEKQANAAKKKKDKKQEKELKLQSETQNERLVTLTNKIQEIFENVFVHRYKDSANHIRALCMASLGGWIQASPDEFLQDNYLKYIGWTISDKVNH